MEVLQEVRPLIKYSICFDDIMRTYLTNEGITYYHPYGVCFEFEYDIEGEHFWDRVKYPKSGFMKYPEFGITVEKIKTESLESLIELAKKTLAQGKCLPVHYDGYYCPWDTQQKIRRWHNRHTVLITGLNERKKYFSVADPFYLRSKEKLPFSTIGWASEFYLKIDTSSYVKTNGEDIHQSVIEKIKAKNHVESMESFLSDFIAYTSESKIDEPLFCDKWESMIEEGYMTRHYMWVFYSGLHKETGKSIYALLAVLFFHELQDWKECVVHSLKGWGHRDQKKYYTLFANSFHKVIKDEQKIVALLLGRSRGQNIGVIESASIASNCYNQQPINISASMNARGCKKNRRDRIFADITGEGEYVLPKWKLRKEIKFGKIRYEVALTEKKDHIRCQGQTIKVAQGKYKGVCVLVCSEWGRSQLLFEIRGKKKYYTDFILQDFCDKGDYSIPIGKTYLKSSPKDIRIQKMVYFQSVFFPFPENEQIKSIKLPDCPSVHIFAMVLLQ